MSTEENFYDFTCPYCKETVSYTESAAGHLRECINCMESFIAPEQGGQEAVRIPLPIATPRLVLRRFEAGDIYALLELAADEEFFLHAKEPDFDLASEVSRWLEQERQIRLTTEEQVFRLAIVIRENNALIGDVGGALRPLEQTTLEIKLHRKYREQGFEREAAEAWIGFCFGALKLHRVTAECGSLDTAACRLFEEIGMRREAEFVKNTRLTDGTWTNTIWFAVLEEERVEAVDDDSAPNESADSR